MTEQESQESKQSLAEIEAEFDSFEELLQHFASRISEEGVALSTQSAFETGSAVTFELRVRDAFPVLRGAGEVVESSQLDEESSLRFEHTLRYVHLDPPSIKLLPRLIEHYRKRGLPLLDLPPAAIPPPAGAEAPPSEEPEMLTLADLEDEFAAPVDAVDDAVDEIGDETGDETSAASDAASPYSGEETVGDLEVSAPSEPTAEEPVEEGVDNEIRVDDLMSSEELLVDSELLSVPDEVELPAEDQGLPWLPEASEAQRRSDVRTTVVVAIVVGLLLAIAFYFLVLRKPTSNQSQQRVPSSVATAITSIHATFRCSLGAIEAMSQVRSNPASAMTPNLLRRSRELAAAPHERIAEWQGLQVSAVRLPPASSRSAAST